MMRMISLSQSRDFLSLLSLFLCVVNSIFRKLTSAAAIAVILTGGDVVEGAGVCGELIDQGIQEAERLLPRLQK